MNTTTKLTLGIVSAIVIFCIIAISSIVATNNKLVKIENDIIAQYENNKNVYDNYFKKVKEAVQIPSIYVKDLEKVYSSAIQNRYGSGGSKAIFQWIREHNPNLDSSLYLKIQQIIESGRNEFKLEQTTLLDKKRVYLNELRQFPTNIIASTLGYPRIDLKNINIVTSDETVETFKTKKTAPIKMVY